MAIGTESQESPKENQGLKNVLVSPGLLYFFDVARRTHLNVE
jgi:hypothetical protein